MYRFFKSEVVGNSYQGKYFKLLDVSPLSETIMPEPGQFYMLQAGDTNDPLLKRPFSIFNCKDKTLKFLYRIRGKGTLCLSRLKEGDTLQIIGPLGNSYPYPEDEFIAVAGGIGVASLLPLLEKFKNKAYLFYGARNSDELVMVDEAKAVSKKLIVTTDDGSEGQKGFITDALAGFLNENRLPVYACGPAPMLKELSRVVAGKYLKCLVSLEEHMACGVGACLGCVVKTVSGHKRVCKEGPVFDLKDIVW